MKKALQTAMAIGVQTPPIDGDYGTFLILRHSLYNPWPSIWSRALRLAVCQSFCPSLLSLCLSVNHTYRYDNLKSINAKLMEIQLTYIKEEFK